MIKNTKLRNKANTYKFDEGLIAISADITLGVNDLTERLTKLNELFFNTLPRQVTQVKHFRWRLCISKLRLI